MLVLSRKQDEKIIIGDSITLMVVSIQGDKVRLGIEAPKDMLVLRDELEPFGRPDQASSAGGKTPLRRTA